MTAVVLYHAVGRWVPSGFVGVDVFFVISGYLIGGIIYAATIAGRFGFVEFYARRARRILPALVVVVSCCGVAALSFMTAGEAAEFGAQAAAALVGGSNFWFGSIPAISRRRPISSRC